MKSTNFYQNLKWKKYSFHIKFPKHDAIKNDFFLNQKLLVGLMGKNHLKTNRIIVGGHFQQFNNSICFS